MKKLLILLALLTAGCAPTFGPWYLHGFKSEVAREYTRTFHGSSDGVERILGCNGTRCSLTTMYQETGRVLFTTLSPVDWNADGLCGLTTNSRDLHKDSEWTDSVPDMDGLTLCFDKHPEGLLWGDLLLKAY